MLLVLVLSSLGCGAAAPSSVPGASAPAATPPGTPTPAATATVAATSAAPAPSPPILDSVTCARGEELAAGTYRSPYVWRMAITLSAPAGWRFCREDVPGGGVIALVRGEGNEIGHAREWLAFFAIPFGEDVRALVDELQATPLLDVGALEDAVVGGEPGVAFDATARPNPDQPGNDEVAPGAIGFPGINRIFAPHMWLSETPEARFRLTVVGHGQQGLVVYLEAPPDAFDQLAADAAPVIESVSFID